MIRLKFNTLCPLSLDHSEDQEIGIILDEEIEKVCISFGESFCTETQITLKYHLVTYVLTKDEFVLGG